MTTNEILKKAHLPSSPKESHKLVLKDCEKNRGKLEELLGGCFALQKLYGKSPEDAPTITKLFQTILAEQPAEKVTKALEIWLQRSTEFPTPADIIALIKNNGKPPVSEARIASIFRKNYNERSTEENWILRKYEEEQNEGF